MNGPRVIHHDKTMLHKWFATNRGTHWSIAGAVAVIILGSYLVYSNSQPVPPIHTSSAAAGPPTAAVTPDFSASK